MKTRDQYRYERDALQRERDRLNKQVDRLEREVLDYQTAMRRMQGHVATILAQPASEYKLGWLDAIKLFSDEVKNATTTQD